MNSAPMMVFVLIGGRLADVLRIIITVPVATVMSLVIEEFIANKHEELKKTVNQIE